MIVIQYSDISRVCTVMIAIIDRLVILGRQKRTPLFNVGNPKGRASRTSHEKEHGQDWYELEKHGDGPKAKVCQHIL